jgi:hypothetical protein
VLRDDETVVAEVRKCGDMYLSQARGAAAAMSDNENELVVLMTERFERRLSEETGALRVEMAQGFGSVRAEMAQGLGSLRAEMEKGFGSVRTSAEKRDGVLRAEMAQGLGVLRGEIGALRAEMIDRNAALLRWGLMFAVTQTAAIAGIVALVR